MGFRRLRVKTTFLEELIGKGCSGVEPATPIGDLKIRSTRCDASKGVIDVVVESASFTNQADQNGGYFWEDMPVWTPDFRLTEEVKG